jgi:hypothetical protein
MASDQPQHSLGRRIFKKLYHAAIHSLPIKQATQLQYYRYHKLWANLDNPKTLNEHLAARKIAWTGPHSDPRLIMLSDKIAVKEHVARVLGPEWVTPTLWRGKDLNDCPSLPFPYVIKVNHGSDRNIFVYGPDDLIGAKEQCDIWLAGRTAWRLAEEWYNHIEPKIFIEPFIGDDGQAPVDYKLFCFENDIPCIQIDTARFTDHRRCFYDEHWKKLDFGHYYPLETEELPRPPNLDQILAAARTLAQGFEFVRIDFYDKPSGPLFGEMTFSPTSGFGAFRPPSTDAWLGTFWKDKPEGRFRTGAE